MFVMERGERLVLNPTRLRPKEGWRWGVTGCIKSTNKCVRQVCLSLDGQVGFCLTAWLSGESCGLQSGEPVQTTRVECTMSTGGGW